MAGGIQGVQAPGGGNNMMNNVLPGALLMALLTHLVTKGKGPAPKDGAGSNNIAQAAPQIR